MSGSRGDLGLIRAKADGTTLARGKRSISSSGSDCQNDAPGLWQGEDQRHHLCSPQQKLTGIPTACPDLRLEPWVHVVAKPCFGRNLRRRPRHSRLWRPTPHFPEMRHEAF